MTWLAEHPDAREVVCSVWTTLTELERAGHHPGALDALRFVLIHHQPPTHAGRCPTCRRLPWRQLWRRRPFPCVVWRQIRGELLGHLIASYQTPRHRARSSRTGVGRPDPDRFGIVANPTTQFVWFDHDDGWYRPGT